MLSLDFVAFLLKGDPHFSLQAISFSNLYAPEHLIINVQDAEKWEGLVENAGNAFFFSLFVSFC